MSLTNVQFSVAVHVMTALGYYPNRQNTSSLLATSVEADPTFIRRVLSKLSKAGLITATRGRHGASALAKPPEQITLLDIYRAAEAPATFSIHAYQIEEGCAISENIRTLMSKVLDQAQDSFEESLGEQTLADIVAGVRDCYSDETA